MTNITTIEEVKNVSTITLPLVELKKMIDYVPEVDEDKVEDPMWEQIILLWEMTSEELYGTGGEVEDLLRNGKSTKLMVELEDGTTEPFSVFDHRFI